MPCGLLHREVISGVEDTLTHSNFHLWLVETQWISAKTFFLNLMERD